MSELAVYGPPWRAVSNPRDILFADPPGPHSCASHLALAAYSPGRGELVRATGRAAVEREAYRLAVRTGRPAYVLQGAILTGSGRWLWPVATDVVELELQNDPDPLTREGFAEIVEDLQRDLVRSASAAERRAIEGAGDQIERDWLAMSDPERDLAIAGLAVVIAGIGADPEFIVEAAQSLEAIATSVTGASVLGSGGISASLSLPDRALARRIGRDGMAFVTNEYRVRSELASREARKVIARGARQGLGRRDLGRELANAMRGRAMGRSENYYQIVASSVVSRGRSLGQMIGYQEAGIETYQWEAVLDARTCLRGDSQVTMGDGSRREIQHVRPGDRVLSCCGKTREVLATHAVGRRIWLQVELSNGSHLHITPPHPILTPDGWVRAGALRVGDKVVIAGDGEDYDRLRSLWAGVRREVSSEILLRAVSDDLDPVSDMPPKVSRAPSSQTLAQNVLKGVFPRAPTAPLREKVSPLRGAVVSQLVQIRPARVMSLAASPVQEELRRVSHLRTTLGDSSTRVVNIAPRLPRNAPPVATLARVERIDWQQYDQPEPAFDLEVAVDKGFVAQNVVVHNCEICRFLHGQVFSVPETMRRFERALRNPDPEAAVNEMPWYRVVGGTTTPEGFRQGGTIFVSPRGVGPTTPLAEVRQSAVGENDLRGTHRIMTTPQRAGGTPVPPAHGRCRCTTIPNV